MGQTTYIRSLRQLHRFVR